MSPDRLWLWGHLPGSHDGMFGLPDRSSISLGAAASQLGIPNAMMVCFAGEPLPPFEPYTKDLANLRGLAWSIVGDASSIRNDSASDVTAVAAMASSVPALRAGLLDDFFHWPVREGRLARYDVEAVTDFRQRLHSVGLELWVVVYELMLDLPIQAYLDECDGVMFWTWESRHLAELEQNIARLKAITPRKRTFLGLYLWDYAGERPLSSDAVDRELRIAEAALRDGRVDSVILLGSGLVDLGLDSVDRATAWIRRLTRGDTAPYES